MTTNTLQLTTYYAMFVVIVMSFCSCEKFLSARTDKQLATPQTGKDLQAILDDVAVMNYEKPTGLTEIASDNVYIDEADWLSRPDYFRMEYIWAREPVYEGYWQQAYRAILAANTVIDHLDKVSYMSLEVKRKIKGAAFFHRGYTFFELAQVFAPPLNVNVSNPELPGIVLRLSSDINDVSRRSTLRDTYSQIITDLKIAAQNLPPLREIYPTRPSKVAAFGALARCYLAVGDYQNAGNYADSCLMLHDEILDFNKISTNSAYPFERFNPEVIFYTQITGYGSLSQNIAKVDKSLYSLFANNDLRKKLFFTDENDGYHSFSGDYGANSNVFKFGGITSAEMLLIRMECALRTGNTKMALKDLLHFVDNRYESGSWGPIGGLDHAHLLKRILEERRKELLYRGIRWSDIRRLAYDPDNAVELKRKMGNTEYSITSEALKTFAFLIPTEVVDATGILQN